MSVLRRPPTGARRMASTLIKIIQKELDGCCDGSPDVCCDGCCDVCCDVCLEQKTAFSAVPSLIYKTRLDQTRLNQKEEETYPPIKEDRARVRGIYPSIPDDRVLAAES